jgi:hypothetical protein
MRRKIICLAATVFLQMRLYSFNRAYPITWCDGGASEFAPLSLIMAEIQKMSLGTTINLPRSKCTKQM